MNFFQWLGITCIVIAITAAVSCSSSSQTYSVRYEVQSNAENSIKISVFNQTGGDDEFESSEKEWSKEYKFEVDSCALNTARVFATINESSSKYVKCSIYVDGELRDTETSNGSFVSAIASCYIKNDGINCPSTE